MRAAILLMAICGVGQARLPSFIQVCRRNDPNLSECVLRSIQALQPFIANGALSREVQAPSVDPFVIDHITFGNERTLKVTNRNVITKGGSNFKIEKLRVNLKDLKFDVLLNFPFLEMSSQYKFVFNFLNAPFTSEGDMFTSVANTKCRITMKGNLVSKNGVNYLQFSPFQLKINVGDIKALKISNLFQNSRALSEAVNALLRNNKDFLVKDIVPEIEKQLSQIFTNLANKITSAATFDELFPQ